MLLKTPPPSSNTPFRRKIAGKVDFHESLRAPTGNACQQTGYIEHSVQFIISTYAYAATSIIAEFTRTQQSTQLRKNTGV